MYAFWYSRIRKDVLERGTYFVRVLGTDGEKTAVTYRVAAVLLFGDGASAGVIRKELRRFRVRVGAVPGCASPEKSTHRSHPVESGYRCVTGASVRRGGPAKKISDMSAKVGVIMGSTSDWEVMAAAAETLEAFGIPYEKRVVSAHRTPDLLVEYAKTARGRGIEVIIAGAGGAAHLPGMVASMTPLPVVGVAGQVACAQRTGLVAVDRSDAGRRARWRRWRSTERRMPH